jgi:hypothetical protein
MRFLSKWLWIVSSGVGVAFVGVACGGESSSTPLDADGGQGGASGAAGRGAGGDVNVGGSGGSGGSSAGASGTAGAAGDVGSGGSSGAAGAAGKGSTGGDAGAGGAAGGAGKGGAGGGAGKGGSGGAAGKGGATGGAGADGGMTCGGLAAGKCGMDSYCEFEPRDCRSAIGLAGVCAPRPVTCTKDCPGVCGCDGKFYCNACIAHSEGIDDTTDTSCMRSADGGPRGDAGAGEPCKTEDQCQAGLRCCPACPIPGCPIPSRCMATDPSGQCPPPPP